MSNSTKAPLDINHSHFILVDNGTIGEFGVEIGLRSSLEGAILQNLKTESSSSAGTVNVGVSSFATLPVIFYYRDKNLQESCEFLIILKNFQGFSKIFTLSSLFAERNSQMKDSQAVRLNIAISKSV